VPAVDVLGDEAVRLLRGDFDDVVLRAGEPAAVARRLAARGARWIHVVDLAGARGGECRPALARRVAAAAAPAAIQFGGGIRSVPDAERVLAAGARRAVVATAAFAAGSILEELAAALGDALVVAVDVRASRVRVGGWRRAAPLTPAEAVARCAEAGVARLLCTGVERDGTLGGPDTELLYEVCAAASMPVLAAGGIATRADLAAVAAAGCEGAVVGRAALTQALPVGTVLAA
jgi:phosphoribosylformimino-5-aminoimidazole carboxamide ribotide isomerase